MDCLILRESCAFVGQVSLHNNMSQDCLAKQKRVEKWDIHN